jgi:hypothetical protein
MPVAAQGDDVRMLDEQKLVGNQAALPSLDKLPLQLERFRVAEPSQVAYFAGSQFGHGPLLRC